MKSHLEIKCRCGAVICRCMCLEPKKLEIREHPACQDQRAVVAWGERK